jgi:4-amino-4-deoxy-L-arabinose transferase-like glycosyltransferase
MKNVGGRWVALVVLAVLFVAGATRLVELTKEPFWIDEILSIDLSAGKPQQILRANAHDTHPPLYYLGLAGWRQLLGDGEATIRGFSVAWSMIALIATLLLGRALGASPHTGVLAGTLLALSALDVYYAQEARMYAQLAALITLAALFLWRFMTVPATATSRLAGAGWAGAFFLTAIAAVHTHYLAAIVLTSQGLFAVAALTCRRQWARLAGFTAGALVSALAFLPWILFVRAVRGGLYSAEHVGWIPMPSLWDLSGGLLHELVWAGAKRHGAAGLTQIVLTGIIAAIVGYGLARAASAQPLEAGGVAPTSQTDRQRLAFAGWLVAGPLVLAWFVSHAYHPVVFLPRFATVVLPPFLVLAALAIGSVADRTIRWVMTFFLAGVLAAATLVQAVVPNKVGLAQFAALWRDAGPPDLTVFWPAYNARTASYYLRENVSSATRNEVERTLQLNRQALTLWLCADRGLRSYETASDRQLEDWLLGLGPSTSLGTYGNLEVMRIVAQPRAPDFPLLQRGRRLSLGDVSSEAFLPNGWYGPEATFRWSEGKSSTIAFSVDGPAYSELVLEMFCYGSQRLSFELNSSDLAAFVCSERSPHIRRLVVPAALSDRQNVLVIRHLDAISPQERGESDDRRLLALGISWLEVH